MKSFASPFAFRMSLNVLVGVFLGSALLLVGCTKPNGDSHSTTTRNNRVAHTSSSSQKQEKNSNQELWKGEVKTINGFKGDLKMILEGDSSELNGTGTLEIFDEESSFTYRFNVTGSKDKNIVSLKLDVKNEGYRSLEFQLLGSEEKPSAYARKAIRGTFDVTSGKFNPGGGTFLIWQFGK